MQKTINKMEKKYLQLITQIKKDTFLEVEKNLNNTKIKWARSIKSHRKNKNVPLTCKIMQNLIIKNLQIKTIFFSYHT